MAVTQLANRQIEVVSDYILAMQACGSNIKGHALGCPLGLASVTGNGVADNTPKYVAIWVPKAATLTGVMFFQQFQGAYTSDQTNQVGIFQHNGAGTLNLLVASNDNGNLWKGAANSLIKEPFSSTIAVTAGVYWVGLLYNQSAETTFPRIAHCPSGLANQFSADLTNSVDFCGTQSAQNSLPSSVAFSSITQSTTRPWVGVY